jgi:hypothetical protein
MIIRVFRPTIHPGKESEFETFLRETAVPLVSQQSGIVAQQSRHLTRPGRLWVSPQPSGCVSDSGCARGVVSCASHSRVMLRWN